MTKKPSKAARACISKEIKKHYKKGKPQGQAAAIAYSICERKGFRSIKRRSSSQLRGLGSGVHNQNFHCQVAVEMMQDMPCGGASEMRAVRGNIARKCNRPGIAVNLKSFAADEIDKKNNKCRRG